MGEVGAHCINGNQSIEHIHNLLKALGNVLAFRTEISIVDGLRACFKDDSFLSKECGAATIP